MKTHQEARGCRHEKVAWTKADHPRYGNKVPYFIKSKFEVDCDKSCGGRG